MRAKRSKKYRKLMHQYELTFGFREPYQVLVDSNLLRAVHSFKMELIPALERTLQGKVKPCTSSTRLLSLFLYLSTTKNELRILIYPAFFFTVLTKCSLENLMAGQPLHPRTNNPIRPECLPPPTTLPLRHCSHNEDSTPIDETECLLSLLSPSTDSKKNKEHYILATADPPGAEKAAASANANKGGVGQKRKRGPDEGELALRRAQSLRRQARSIPGVPIVYVKRSVMILEPMSMPSDEIREGVEKGKFRVGLTDETINKKKREGAGEAKDAKKKPGFKKAKGPNPLSVKKPKKKVAETVGSTKQRPAKEEGQSKHDSADEGPGGADGDSAAPKPKRRRRHHKGARRDGDDGEQAPSLGAEAVASVDVMEE
ncbi:rRNA-binding ribosome biosynthesis protein UTP23 [Aspergillus affinis]|uniref:rRNA-binding ribosome biosynthesis protein UTP23 n=1 Tax=Aspergillus affinis TaxID=1070780 RepID=UPI0022FEF55B|nr:uncharacterized protein KD926_002685 [Aspergillus affinis]KAI9043795.1 hypothetical protein KD926_002685 [Aspergillus affinis]